MSTDTEQSKGQRNAARLATWLRENVDSTDYLRSRHLDTALDMPINAIGKAFARIEREGAEGLAVERWREGRKGSGARIWVVTVEDGDGA